MLHGNGGATSRFSLFADYLAENPLESLRLHLPELPGFEDRPLPAGPVDWPVFLEPLAAAVAAHPDEPWLFYGHGIGGSILLEWAARDWVGGAPPLDLWLHAPIGASLNHRFFPRLMRPRWVRALLHRLIYTPALQPVWEKRLFREPAAIPAAVRNRFFRDYARCAAFPVFFDLITPGWYEEVQARLTGSDFFFVWGAEERVVAARFLDFWRRDFPGARFEVVPEWDHFPMLDRPAAFYGKMKSWLDPFLAQSNTSDE